MAHRIQLRDYFVIVRHTTADIRWCSEKYAKQYCVVGVLRTTQLHIECHSVFVFYFDFVQMDLARNPLNANRWEVSRIVV